MLGLLAGVAFAGGLTGVLGAVLGTGGGVFLIPMLVLAFGVPMHVAVATSLMSVVATSMRRGEREHRTRHREHAARDDPGTCYHPGALAGGLTAGLLPARALEGLFAVVLLPVAYLMGRGRTGHEAPERAGNGLFESSPTSDAPEDLGALGARFHDDAEDRNVSYRVERLPAGMGIAFVAGNLSGLLGIGGGVFKVPALHLLCRVPIKAAAATSNFMIGVTAAASAFLYYGRGEVHPTLTASAVLGVLAGSAIGSVVNRYIGGASIRVLFGGLLGLVAVWMLARSIGAVP